MKEPIVDVFEVTKDYESWMAGHIPLVREDLDLKHKRMAEATFPFLRATFYRWAQLWRETCTDLATGPEVLAVGDLHIENFGTWRDAEGRLVWGINDFDEACRMPYAIDLVRLAASAVIARKEQNFEIAANDACEALLEGYIEGIDAGGKAFVLEESHHALREMALGAERDPVRFWSKMNSWPDCHTAPSPVLALMKAHLPSPDLPFRVVHRVAGLGSLGRQRYVALAMWHGGMVAREAKALLPSAWEWACGKPETGIHYDTILKRTERSPDPHAAVVKNWLVRRLAPHCSRIEIADFPAVRDNRRLLHAMGREIANTHVGTPETIPAIKLDLKKRKSGWLHDATQAMVEVTMCDWKIWRAR
jgi:hypothetical protein